MTTDVLSLAEQLIACPSISPHDAGCQKIIRECLTRLGFECEALPFGDVDNLWAKYGKSSPLVIFAGHTDVVPTGPETDWISPPFLPEKRNGFLYGRGACDMKSAIAAMILAVENFIKEQPDFPGTIAFLITSDEEADAINGTQKVIEVLQQRGEKIDYCLIGEPSSEHQIGDQVRVGRRGSLHGQLIIHGKQGHVAHPHLATNPIHMAALALHELAQTEWDKGNDSFPPTTFQITNVHSGTGAANVIPGHLEILFNFRFSTAVTIEELQERTEKLLHQHRLKFNLEWTVGGHPFLTKRNKLIQVTEQAIKEITGLAVKLSTGGGTSDGRFIASTGAEIVELGVSHSTAHQVDECVKIEDLETLVTLYQLILKKLFY
ncbi:MAG: succinyl-diaminopimelate desuccinylase [Gammaproteobacteria bacterium]|nr:succinyl-diaminopimelate desuccinylase [Gammaproteobacteria bacterium]